MANAIGVDPVDASEVGLAAVGWREQKRLWFYVLRQADVPGGGDCLGPVGGADRRPSAEDAALVQGDDADADVPALGARLLPLRDPVVVVDGFEHLLQHALVVAAVVDVPRRRPVGKLVRADQVAAADLDAVEAEVVRGQVDKPLEHPVGDLGAEAAIGALLVLVRQDRGERVTLTLREAAYEEPVHGEREMETLTQMKCVACRRDAPTVTDAEIAEFHRQVSDWEIVELDGVKRLRRVFSVDDFAQALGFTNKVGELAEAEGHHPALLTEWGRTTVTWWTHKITGLHRNDFIMAAKTDELYQR